MERKVKLVVDASVAVKWFATEKYSEKALKIRDAYFNGDLELLAPDLIYYEVANALRFHRKLKFSKDDIVNAINSIKLLHITCPPSKLDWLKASELSLGFNISMYDAIYIAFAINRECRLVTSDEKLYNKLNELQDNVIVLLKDYNI